VLEEKKSIDMDRQRTRKQSNALAESKGGDLLPHLKNQYEHTLTPVNIKNQYEHTLTPVNIKIKNQYEHTLTPVDIKIKTNLG
jgi:hypothetical protein